MHLFELFRCKKMRYFLIYKNTTTCKSTAVAIFVSILGLATFSGGGKVKQSAEIETDLLHAGNAPVWPPSVHSFEGENLLGTKRYFRSVSARMHSLCCVPKELSNCDSFSALYLIPSASISAQLGFSLCADSEVNLFFFHLSLQISGEERKLYHIASTEFMTAGTSNNCPVNWQSDSTSDQVCLLVFGKAMVACLCWPLSRGRSINIDSNLDVLLLFTAAGLLGVFAWSSVIRGKLDTVLELLGLFSFSGDSCCFVGLPWTERWTTGNLYGLPPPGKCFFLCFSWSFCLPESLPSGSSGHFHCCLHTSVLHTDYTAHIFAEPEGSFAVCFATVAAHKKELAVVCDDNGMYVFVFATVPFSNTQLHQCLHCSFLALFLE